MDMTVVDILREFGILVALVLFFTWQGWKRETRLNDRITVLEEDYTSTLKELIASCTEVIAANTAVMQRLESHLNRVPRDRLEE